MKSGLPGGSPLLQPKPENKGWDGTILSLGSFSKILASGLRLGWIQSDPDHLQLIARCGLLTGTVISIVAILTGGMIGLQLYAAGENISLMLAIEENTRATVALLQRENPPA